MTTLETFWNTPQGDGAIGFIGYKGLFYHFLDMNTATRVWSSELSTIDTALLIAGILDAKQYFDTLAQEAKGNVSEMARRAGMERAHVRTYLKRHGIDVKQYR